MNYEFRELSYQPTIKNDDTTYNNRINLTYDTTDTLIIFISQLKRNKKIK